MSDSDEAPKKAVRKASNASSKKGKASKKQQDSDMDEDSSEEEAKPVRKSSRVSEKSAASKASKKKAVEEEPEEAEAEEEEGPKELFVGNISYQATEDELYNHFSQWGEVTNVKIPTERETGRSRGMAFVEFSSHKEASNALDNTNQREYNGRNLRVNFSGDTLKARPKGN